MKIIRKAFQGTVPDNKILDIYSDSNTDTYSCRKVNELIQSNPGSGGGDINIEDIVEKPKNIITAYLSEPTNMAITAWEPKKVPLDTFIGNNDKLKLENGSIVVGEGLKQVRINASIRLAAEFAAGYYGISIKITKKDGTMLPTIAQYQQKHSTQVSNAITINPYLEDVDEGDAIDLLFTSSVTQTQGLVQNQITSLTVEAIEDSQAITINEGLDTIPVNSVFEYEGDVIPEGYEALPSLVDIVYPVGSIYMNVNNINPKTLFSGTDWERFGKGKTLVGLDEADNDFNVSGKTGGSKYTEAHSHDFETTATNKTLTGSWSNTRSRFAGTNNFAGIVKDNRQSVEGYYNETGGTDTNTVGWSIDARHEHSGTTNVTGEGDSGNLQPYITVYMWKRIS